MSMSILLQLEREINLKELSQHQTRHNHHLAQSPADVTQSQPATKQEITLLVAKLMTVLGELEKTLKQSLKKLETQIQQLIQYEKKLILGKVHVSPEVLKEIQDGIKGLLENIKNVVGHEQKEIGQLHSLAMSLEKLIKKPLSLMTAEGDKLLAQIANVLQNLLRDEHSKLNQARNPH